MNDHSVKQSVLTHDEELKLLSKYMTMPYNSTLKYISEVAYYSPDILYHYHFIRSKNVMKSTETRLLGIIKSRIKEAKKGLAEIEEKVKSELKEYSPVVQCLMSQKDECTTKQFGQYKYSICIGGEASQDSVKLGEWKLDLDRDYIRNSTVEYTGGTRCWNGIERRLIARFECGSHEEIVSLSEPSTCHYEAVMKSPCFCSEELLDTIKAKMVSFVCCRYKV